MKQSLRCIVAMLLAISGMMSIHADVNIYVRSTDAPYVYAWVENSTGTATAWPLGDWPGTKMTLNDGKDYAANGYGLGPSKWWFIKVETTDKIKIILHDGNGNQTATIPSQLSSTTDINNFLYGSASHSYYKPAHYFIWKNGSYASNGEFYLNVTAAKDRPDYVFFQPKGGNGADWSPGSTPSGKTDPIKRLYRSHTTGGTNLYAAFTTQPCGGYRNGADVYLSTHSAAFTGTATSGNITFYRSSSSYPSGIYGGTFSAPYALGGYYEPTGESSGYKSSEYFQNIVFPDEYKGPKPNVKAYKCESERTGTDKFTRHYTHYITLDDNDITPAQLPVGSKIYVKRRWLTYFPQSNGTLSVRDNTFKSLDDLPTVATITVTSNSGNSIGYSIDQPILESDQHYYTPDILANSTGTLGVNAQGKIDFNPSGNGFYIVDQFSLSGGQDVFWYNLVVEPAGRTKLIELKYTDVECARHKRFSAYRVGDWKHHPGTDILADTDHSLTLTAEQAEYATLQIDAPQYLKSPVVAIHQHACETFFGGLLKFSVCDLDGSELAEARLTETTQTEVDGFTTTSGTFSTFINGQSTGETFSVNKDNIDLIEIDFPLSVYIGGLDVKLIANTPGWPTGTFTSTYLQDTGISQASINFGPLSSPGDLVISGELNTNTHEQGYNACLNLTFPAEPALSRIWRIEGNKETLLNNLTDKQFELHTGEMVNTNYSLLHTPKTVTEYNEEWDETYTYSDMLSSFTINDLMTDVPLSDLPNREKKVTYLIRAYLPVPSGDVTHAPRRAPRKADTTAGTGTVSEDGEYYILEQTIDVTFHEDVITGVDTVGAPRTVASESYHNLSGQVSSRPFDGLNIVVTRYTDGTKSTRKVFK